MGKPRSNLLSRTDNRQNKVYKNSNSKDSTIRIWENNNHFNFTFFFGVEFRSSVSMFADIQNDRSPGNQFRKKKERIIMIKTFVSNLQHTLVNQIQANSLILT